LHFISFSFNNPFCRFDTKSLGAVVPQGKQRTSKTVFAKKKNSEINVALNFIQASQLS
jgi:hypothetical protein